MKTKDEIEKKLLGIGAMAQDGVNPDSRELLAQQQILEWVLEIN